MIFVAGTLVYIFIQMNISDDVCEYDPIAQAVTSPLGNYTAQEVSGVCGAPGSQETYLVSLLKNKDEQSRQIIFASNSKAENVHWSDERSLSVTINHIDQIQVSKHEYQGIKIEYFVSDNINKDKLNKMEEDEIAWAKENRSAYADRLVPQIQDKFNRFRLWVEHNVKSK